MQLRLVVHTVMYVLSVAAVLAAAINPVGTAAALRKLFDTAPGAPVVAASERVPRRPLTQTKTRELRPGEYRVAIGTILSARLRSAIDSATARANDQVDAVLTEPLVQDGVELIPSGSAVHGSIVLAEAATKVAPLGRLEVIFTVVQHAQTRSRAAIRTRPLTFEADPPPDTGSGKKAPKRQPVDVVVPSGQPLVLTLGEALVVYIPTAR